MTKKPVPNAEQTCSEAGMELVSIEREYEYTGLTQFVAHLAFNESDIEFKCEFLRILLAVLFAAMSIIHN